MEGQTVADKVNERLSISMKYLEGGKITDALQVTQEALLIMHDGKIPLLELRCFDIMAQSYIQIKEYSSALSFRLRGLDVATHLKDSLLVSRSYKKVGELYITSGIYDKASDNLVEALEWRSSRCKFDYYARLLELVAYASFREGYYAEAASYYRELLSGYSQKGNKKAYVNALKMLSQMYLMMPSYQEALEVYELLIAEFAVQGLDSGVSDCNNNIAYIYLKTGRTKEALDTFEALLEDEKGKEKPDSLQAITLINIAICAQNLDDYNKAEAELKKAITLYHNVGAYQNVAQTEMLLAKVYLLRKDTYNAEMHIIESIETSKRGKWNNELEQAYKIYSELLQQNGNFEEALEFYKQHLSLRDSNFHTSVAKAQDASQIRRGIEQAEASIKLGIADENMRDLTVRQLQLETKQKAQKITLLQRNHELQESVLQRQRQELNLARQQNKAQSQKQHIQALEQDKVLQAVKLREAELEEQEQAKTIKLLETEKKISELKILQQQDQERSMQRLFAFMGIVLILILIGFFYSRRANRRLADEKRKTEHKNKLLQQKSDEVIEQNAEIVGQRVLLNKKNNDITNSLIYAKRIQQAAMPSISLLGEGLADHFVFLSPRDIVSGDFYWVGKQNNDLYIAVTDCTGHGAPGAFMSMLGISFLNDIILSRHTREANQVLEKLRDLVKSSLKQESNNRRAKDGMDIALAIVDLENNIMQFSGANNSLLLVRNNEIQVFKGDRNPIGVYVKEKPFTKVNIQLEKDDRVYLFTDGYVDQFGGEYESKFMIKRFKALILSIHKEPMKMQRAKLREKLGDWQGNEFTQTDDVLVLGFKV